MRFRRRFDSRGVVLSIKACLQLAYPVPARGYGVVWILFEIPLKPALVEVRMIEGYKAWLLPPETPNKCQLRNDDVGDEAELRLLRKIKAFLGFSLCVCECLSAGDQVGDQMIAAKGCVGEVTGSQCDVKSAPHERLPRAHMFCPRNNQISEGHVDTRLGMARRLPLYQAKAEFSEPKARWVIAEE